MVMIYYLFVIVNTRLNFAVFNFTPKRETQEHNIIQFLSVLVYYYVYYYYYRTYIHDTQYNHKVCQKEFPLLRNYLLSR